MVTLDTVAKHAAVSKATVSQVLNGRGRFSSTTRKRVRQAAIELKYRTRPTGRPRAAADRIGIICARDVSSEPRASYFQKLINTIHDEVVDGGDSPRLLVGAGTLARSLITERIIRNELNAVIIVGVREDDGYLDLLSDLKIPAVVVHVRSEPQRFSSVRIDDYGGLGDAVDALVGLGHRRIAMVHNTHGLSYNLDRQAGFRDALAGHGIEPVAMIPVDPEADLAHAAYRQAIQRCADRATAVCLTNDRMAVQWIDAAEAMGLRVPEDISVVGFDASNVRSASGRLPSSVGYELADSARCATDIARRLLADQRIRFLTATLPARFIERQTTQPPATGGGDIKQTPHPTQGH